MDALIVQNPDNDSTTLTSPLHLQGVTSYLPVRKPTATQWETGDIVRIDMMAENLNWDPNDPTYTSQEAAMTDHRGVVLPRPDRGQPFVINTLSSMMTDTADITDDENFGVALEQHVTVIVAALDTAKTAPGWIHFKAGKLVDAETLAKCWLIPANRAARTVDRTTQQGVFTMLNPTLSCRFPTNNCMLRYPRMPHPVFVGTLKDGYIRNVPLPRAPQIQSASHLTSHGAITCDGATPLNSTPLHSASNEQVVMDA